MKMWAELIWRLQITTLKSSRPIHISQIKFYFHVQRTHHNIHIFVSFDVEHNVKLDLKTGTVRVELIWRLDFMCILSPLSNTVYERVEWMWRMSERSGVDVENEQAEQSGCGE